MEPTFRLNILDFDIEGVSAKVESGTGQMTTFEGIYDSTPPTCQCQMCTVWWLWPADD